MAEHSKIEWTDATWNPVTGCTKVSRGCDNCYAERLAERFRGIATHPFKSGFDLTLRPERLDQPKKWRQPRMIFVNSMSDLFHKNIPPSYVDAVFETMEQTDRHTYQVLTKRSSRMRDYVNRRYSVGAAPSHIWLGVSVEDGGCLSRLHHLQQTAAGIRFLSLEPLIGPPVPLSLAGIHWVIVGGESGPGARPMHPRWVRSIRDQCLGAGVSFFFKQWGEWAPDCLCHASRPCKTIQRPGPPPGVMFHCGKKRAGRKLDGREWNETPIIQKGSETNA